MSITHLLPFLPPLEQVVVYPDVPRESDVGDVGDAVDDVADDGDVAVAASADVAGPGSGDQRSDWNSSEVTVSDTSSEAVAMAEPPSEEPRVWRKHAVGDTLLWPENLELPEKRVWPSPPIEGD